MNGLVIVLIGIVALGAGSSSADFSAVLFGSANQLLAALVLIALAVFLKTTGRTGWTLYIPMFVMLAVTFTALIQKTVVLVGNFMSGNATLLVDGLQFVVAVLLMVLGVMVAFSCLKKLFGRKAAA